MQHETCEFMGPLGAAVGFKALQPAINRSGVTETAVAIIESGFFMQALTTSALDWQGNCAYLAAIFCLWQGIFAAAANKACIMIYF